jgi:hypothetical protein
MAASRFVAWYRRFYLLVNLPVLLLATELALSWSDPVNWSHSSNLDHALARYQASPPGAAPVMLVLGSSVVRSGIDQSIVEQSLNSHGNWRVYNFGLNTARLDDEIELLEYLRSRGIKPAAIVLGVNLYSIKDAESDSRYPWHRRRSPYIFYHRNYLFNGLKERLSKLITPKQAKSYSQFANAILTPEELDAQARTFKAAFAQRRADDFPMLEQLSVLLRWIADHDIRAYAVVLPMNPVASDFAGYPALVAAIRDRLPPGSLDLSGAGYPKDLFDDVGHLNDSGRRSLTAQIVGWLDPASPLGSP